MSKPVIAVDVDITTLASDVAWWEWLQHMCGTQSELEDVIWYEQKQNREVNYNLSAYFPDPINKRVESKDYWREEGAYNTVVPVVGAVENITKLSTDFDIVFVTHCKRNHSRSKYNCLERHFGHIPFDYVVTKEKHRVDADIIIDDRNEFINQFLNKGKLAVLLGSPYTQYESIQNPENYLLHKANTWDEVVEIVYKELPF